MKSRISTVYKHLVNKRCVTYTMSKQGKSTSRGLANPKVTNYIQGNSRLFHDNLFYVKFTSYSQSEFLLVENSIQSYRITLTRLLGRKVTKAEWYLQIHKRTHVLLRKHKQPSGGAVDRVSMGMRLAYGHPFSRAAKIQKGERFATLYCSKQLSSAYVRACLRKATNKIAAKMHVVSNFNTQDTPDANTENE